MGALDVRGLGFDLPDGRTLFSDASFRIGDGDKVALVGANGAGKTTLLRVVASDETPSNGAVHIEGRLGVMRQFIGSIRNEQTVGGLLLELSPPALREAAERLRRSEDNAGGGDDESGMRLATAHQAWGDAGGWDAEVVWDICTSHALRQPFGEARDRPLAQ
ncbi:MAG: ATP-binding cassette domain-containing protein, partial [Actinomycetia bacterium]|nr:ATP-binding cassette domain-containing protein [Actinomycetes bacterium]